MSVRQAGWEMDETNRTVILQDLFQQQRLRGHIINSENPEILLRVINTGELASDRDIAI